MQQPNQMNEGRQALEQVLGYLNFSSGAADVQFLSALNAIYARADQGNPAGEAPWRCVERALRAALPDLAEKGGAFADLQQADRVIDLVWNHVLPGYLEFHSELLFHQTADSMFYPFFVGRACEAVLLQRGPWDDVGRIVPAAIQHLNDFVGYRPVPTLQHHKSEPHAHEKVRPVPLYIQGAGTAWGPHRQVVELALEILQDADPELLRAAYFDFDLMDELAYDPRAYDFDHPVNKRPNYHFGLWDPHLIDNQGFYRRFVVQQVTLEALMSRIESEPAIPREELRYEAAAVLAGTILMASGISGCGPETHDSTVSLGSLLPRIAAYRDDFYEQLFSRMSGGHAARLRQEAAEKRQPFGGARQHLNAQLARRRASQLEHVHLAKIFAGMGYPDAARQEAELVATTSARILCEIDCDLASGLQAMERGDLDEAARRIPHMRDRLDVGIACGSLIDPWNILGFDAQFSLFPSLENSVRDHRADELLIVMEQIFAYSSRLWSDAAAEDRPDIGEMVAQQFSELSSWWRQFAVHEVQSVEAVDPRDLYQAAELVARAMNLWHRGGAAAGDVAFWAPHAEMFDSPKAYALVIQALLDRGDLVTSMALLVHWLSQSQRIDLERGTSSFHLLSERWLLLTLDESTTTEKPIQRRQLVRRFFDYLEANAEEYWHPPQFELTLRPEEEEPLPDEDPDGQSEEDALFNAAYEDMVYRDSTDDGVESQLFDDEDTTHDELVNHSRAVADRLAFLSCLARLWKHTAVALTVAELDESEGAEDASSEGWPAALHSWGLRAAENYTKLLTLLDDVQNLQIPAPSGLHDSMLEYDRRQMVKESLLERIIASCIEMDNARMLLFASISPAAAEEIEQQACLGEDQKSGIFVLSGLLRGDDDYLDEHWDSLCDALTEQPLLYVPLARGGNPRQIVQIRVRQQMIVDLLSWLPRRGYLFETCDLIEIARQMKRENPIGAGAVTEFDELFKIGYKSLVGTLVASSRNWGTDGKDDATKDDATKGAGSQVLLVKCLEELTQSLLVSWLHHSRTLRLSVLERIHEEKSWQRVVRFIENYGGDLFTQRFLNLGNLRGILHQGPKHWLRQIKTEHPDIELKLLEDLEEKLSFQEAGEYLALILEAIVENYGEYRDYNSTTTQSDRGELLYTLLDFLRLRTRYDRVCWNLRPVIWAHAILVRRDCQEAAEMWRNALQERVGHEAEQYVKELVGLQKKYAMRMPTVADRMAEKFLRPMDIDRICALVDPAMQEAGKPGPQDHFEALRRETAELAREPTGVGLEVPAWIAALEDEVERVRKQQRQQLDDAQIRELVPLVDMTLEDAEEQIEDWKSL